MTYRFRDWKAERSDPGQMRHLSALSDRNHLGREQRRSPDKASVVLVEMLIAFLLRRCLRLMQKYSTNTRAGEDRGGEGGGNMIHV